MPDINSIARKRPIYVLPYTLQFLQIISGSVTVFIIITYRKTKDQKKCFKINSLTISIMAVQTSNITKNQKCHQSSHHSKIWNIARASQIVEYEVKEKHPDGLLSFLSRRGSVNQKEKFKIRTFKKSIGPEEQNKHQVSNTYGAFDVYVSMYVYFVRIL